MSLTCEGHCVVCCCTHKVGDRYEAVLPIHHLWLGYMIEITGLPILLPTPTITSTSHTDPIPITTSTSALLPLFPPKFDSTAAISDLKVNLLTLHAKLVKAEFIGCILYGTLYLLQLAVTDIGSDSETFKKSIVSPTEGNSASRDSIDL